MEKAGERFKLILSLILMADDFMMLYILYSGISKKVLEELLKWYFDADMKYKEIAAWSLLALFYWMGLHFFFFLIIYY